MNTLIGFNYFSHVPHQFPSRVCIDKLNWQMKELRPNIYHIELNFHNWVTNLPVLHKQDIPVEIPWPSHRNLSLTVLVWEAE